MPEFRLRPQDESRQVRFHQLLVAARKTWLMDALRATLARVDPASVKSEIASYAPSEAQRILAAAGIRDEYVFPTVSVLEMTPTLVGYYRLLLGVPQKWFYTGNSGLSALKSMEMHGALNERQRSLLPEFCRFMSQKLGDMVVQLSPAVTQVDIHELPILTVGSYFQGGNNNVIGRQAIDDAFLAIKQIVERVLIRQADRRVDLRTQDGRVVTIRLASDPDISITSDSPDGPRKILAIEVKGGLDLSNVHNRAGEAEKSHAQAKAIGFERCWTIIPTRRVEMAKLRTESRNTDEWFDAGEVLGREGEDWQRFVRELTTALEIPGPASAT